MSLLTSTNKSQSLEGSDQTALRNLHVRATPFGDEKHHSVATVLQHVFMGMAHIPSAQELLSLLVTK